MDDILDQALDDLEATTTSLNTHSVTETEPNKPDKISETPEVKSTSETSNEPTKVPESEVDDLIEQMQKHFSQLGSGAEASGEGDMEKAMAATLASMLNNMSGEAQDGESPFSEAIPNLDGNFGGDLNHDDILDGMMEQLLAKDLMYEPMKEVQMMFPEWLSSNKEKISEEELQRYQKQYECFTRLVNLYENDADNKTAILEAMQEVQEYGQPPKEILDKIAPGMGGLGLGAVDAETAAFKEMMEQGGDCPTM